MRDSGLLMRANKILKNMKVKKDLVIENEGVFKINRDNEINPKKPLDNDLKKLIDSVLL